MVYLCSKVGNDLLWRQSCPTPYLLNDQGTLTGPPQYTISWTFHLITASPIKDGSLSRISPSSLTQEPFPLNSGIPNGPQSLSPSSRAHTSMYSFVCFLPYCVTCGILVPQLGVEPMFPAVEA